MSMKESFQIEALLETWQLVRAQALLWISAICLSSIFCFHIAPGDQHLQAISQKTYQQRSEIMSHIKKIEQLEAKIAFAQEKNEFFMERLIREEFNLKRITPKEGL
jgi:hypothetical protein